MALIPSKVIARARSIGGGSNLGTGPIRPSGTRRDAEGRRPGVLPLLEKLGDVPGWTA
jgi:hypothetical protein